MKLNFKFDRPKIRKTWGFNPESRVKENKKNYDRREQKRELKSLGVYFE